jgi:hypothetical protein
MKSLNCGRVKNVLELTNELVEVETAFVTDETGQQNLHVL